MFGFIKIFIILHLSAWPADLPQPAEQSTASACSKHIYWLQTLNKQTSLDPRCEGQLQEVLVSLFKGLELCEKLNVPETKNLCSMTNPQFESLRKIVAHQSKEQQQQDANAINSQYQGYIKGLNQDSESCLQKFKNLKHDLTCGLPGEFGKLPPPKSWWDQFWNREKSEAPFADIPPSLRLGVSTVASSLLWRFRGGAFLKSSSSNSTLRRAVTALGYTGIGYFNGGSDGAVAGALMTPGLFIPYGNFMVMDSNAPGMTSQKKWENLAAMTGVGLGTTALPAAYLYARGYDPTALVAGGGAKGLCYWGSWNWAPHAFENSSPDKSFVGGSPTQLAELCNGATIGAGLSGSLLYGKKEDKKPKDPPAEVCEKDPSASAQ